MGTRGKKTCECGVEIHARTRVCESCGHVFYEKKVTEPKEVKLIEQSPGKGRKQCQCGRFVGYSIKICPACNQEIITKPKEPKVVKPIEQSPGKGRKQCFECKIFVGGPTAVCPCGHVFMPGEKAEREKKEREERKEAKKIEAQKPITRADRVTQQLLKQFYENPHEVEDVEEIKDLTADDHAHRVLGLGKDRAACLLFQHKTKANPGWGHVNWDLVERALIK